MPRAALALAAATVALLACAPASNAAGTPTITLLAPANNAVVQSAPGTYVAIVISSDRIPMEMGALRLLPLRPNA